MRPGLRLGVDLGGTLAKIALVDHRGRVRALSKVDTVKDPRKLASAVKAAASGWFGRGLLGTGVGVAGDVDVEKGVVRFAPNLGWRNVPLRSLFEKAGFPAPVRMHNDATAAAWGAHHAELGGKSKNTIVLTLGTGVGGGLVLDGKLYGGATGTAGELGHVPVDPNGPACGCGARGCLETFMGGRYLCAEAKRLGLGEVSPKDLYGLARRGNPTARKIWERAGRALGTALAGFINALNPDAVLLVGGVAGAAPAFFPAAREEIRRRAFTSARRAARLLPSAKTPELGVIGAALLVP